MKPVVILYSKPGCHLCDAVEQVIREVQLTHPLELILRNILNDPNDFEKYKHDIPVVTLNGSEIARHRMTADQLQRALNQQT